jgi:nitroimidazol reductase NimA-like FMN-containing flavoprotein (pyridoxamine 5'-phosphate oxidase superfamily)
MNKYHMFKKEKEITDRSVLFEVLKRGKYSVVSLCRENQPYIVTMNYGYDEARKSLYFHSAFQGLKLEFLSQNPRVCATVIEDHGYKKDECSHAYRTVVFWGQMSLVEELSEKKHGMEVLFHHLEDDPDPIRARNFESDLDYKKVNILRLDIEDITGKQGL